MDKVRKTRKDKGLKRGPRYKQRKVAPTITPEPKDPTVYVRDTRKKPTTPAMRFPEHHPLWFLFVSWVESGIVVRSDLLLSHQDSLSGKDWEQIWLIFLAGSIAS